MTNKIEKIKHLIAQIIGLEDFSWFLEIPFQDVDFVLCREGLFAPKENIIDIYTVRERINESRNKPIEGFELLLKNLSSTKAKNVSIHKMKVDEDFIFYIFTTPELDELFGILKIPENLSNKSFT